MTMSDSDKHWEPGTEKRKQKPQLDGSQCPKKTPGYYSKDPLASEATKDLESFR